MLLLSHTLLTTTQKEEERKERKVPCRDSKQVGNTAAYAAGTLKVSDRTREKTVLVICKTLILLSFHHFQSDEILEDC